LFAEDQVTFLQSYTHSTFLYEEIARIRIVQRNNEGKLQFIQYILLSFFVAEFLIKQLLQETKQNTQVQVNVLNEDLLQRDCRVIRAFLDGLLGKKKFAIGMCLKRLWRRTRLTVE
jgi:hypothetical protein